MITYTWFCKFEISKALEFETINLVNSGGYHDNHLIEVES